MAEVNMKDYLDALTEDSSPDSTDYIYVRTAAGSRKRKITDQLNGIGSLAIKTGNGGDIGGYLMDGVNDYITVPDNANLDFGLSDFSIEVYFTLSSLSGLQTFCFKGSLGFSAGYTLILNSGNIMLELTDSVTGNINCTLFSASILSINTPYHLVVNADRDGNVTAYLNGVLTGSPTDISANSGSLNNVYNFAMGSTSSNFWFGGRIFLVRLYNRLLTATEIASIYNNGRPDLYELPLSLRGANNTEMVTDGTMESDSWSKSGNWAYDVANKKYSVTSGALSNLHKLVYMIVGRRYQVTVECLDYVSGSFTVQIGGGVEGYTTIGTVTAAGVFTFDGIMAGNSTLLLQTSTDAQLSVDNVSCVPIGNVAEYLPQNAGSLGWIESSGNQLPGATSGSPICLTKEVRPPQYRDIRLAIAANTDTTLTGIVPRGYKIVSIRAKGSDSLADIKIGSASAGEQIVAATTTSSTTPKLLTLAATANDAYSESAEVTLYARHDTSASGKTMDLIFHFEKVGN